MTITRFFETAPGCSLFSLNDALDETKPMRQLASDEGADPDVLFTEGQIREEVAQAISGLPEKEQMVLSLYYERELNLKEIGEVSRGDRITRLSDSRSGDGAIEG